MAQSHTQRYASTKTGKLWWFHMSNNEWFYISNELKKNEQIRDVRGNLLFDDNDSFTNNDDVPIVKKSTETEEEDVRLVDETT
jgi:outer membrane protein assembly factor BamE (lipoprotein component of BamABCDE complex)